MAKFNNRACIISAIVAIPIVFTLALRGETMPTIGTTLKPRVSITLVPLGGAGPDAMATIGGIVSGVNSRECKVVVFARTNTWYVQPYVASPYTPIGKNGKWETQTHLGDEYAALLVESSYTPPATTDSLPEVGAQVLAIARVSAGSRTTQKLAKRGGGDKPTARKIQFSGYQWKVKSSSGPVGPGPNYFSDSSDNVTVDRNGRLHLRITQHGGHWYCAEVISTRSFGYGTYRFYVDNNIDNIDPRVVLGMFTWSDTPAYHHREIDIEISRWGDTNNKNGQFVVQPYTHAINIVRYQIPIGLNRSTHSFRWQSDTVFCESLKGFFRGQAEKGSIIQQHAFTQDIPEAGDENARINLWLLNGDPPMDSNEVELVISRFEFEPASKRR